MKFYEKIRRKKKILKNDEGLKNEPTGKENYCQRLDCVGGVVLCGIMLTEIRYKNIERF